MRKIAAAIAIAIAGFLTAAAALAQDATPPAYAPDGKMLFPRDYRSWAFLSSGFDMAYVEGAAQTHIFDNVFVNRDAYDAFLKTGAWPDKTVLVLELRAASADDPVVKRGQFQAAAPPRVETHVKDAAKGGWVFYAYGADSTPAAMIPKTANCYSCHAQNAATDTTFTQFYPTLPRAK